MNDDREKYFPEDEPSEENLKKQYTYEHTFEGLGDYPEDSEEEMDSLEEPEYNASAQRMDDTAYHKDDFYRSYTDHEEPMYRKDVQQMIEAEVKRRRPRFRAIKALSLVLVGALLGSILGPFAADRLLPRDSRIGRSTPAEQVSIQPTAETNVETAVYEKAKPSVVGVSTSVKVRNNYFSGSSVAEGLGSGVVLTEDGYILTNSHVISDGEALETSVMFNDGEEAKAEILWYDSTLDLAILKVDRTGLTPVKIGSSDAIKVGDKAIAIGNPLGLDLQSTLTSGHISGLNRSISFGNGLTMEGLMQTDAAINSGNSGGALLNEQGQLIGINTAKNAGAEGIGFAIPVDTAKPIIESIIETGTFSTPILGFSGLDYSTFKRVNQLDVGPDHGAIVMEVMDGVPAASALQRYDIITAIDGQPVDNMGSLKKILLSKKAGESVEITLLRNDEEQNVSVELIERPAE